MRPLAELDARGIQALLVDIDDTLTTDGRLSAEAYAALERLHRAGRRIVPVTGRPAGWCDHIARMWPVDAVVGVKVGSKIYELTFEAFECTGVREVGENALRAYRLDGEGDLTDSHFLWKNAKSLPNVPSPLYYEGVLYTLKEGGILTSYDAKTGDDLTHSVLTQIIVEQENRQGGQTLLPVPFLRQLIRFYDDSIGRMVPGYLQFSLENLVKEQEKIRAQFATAFSNPAAAFEVYQDQARKNM